MSYRSRLIVLASFIIAVLVLLMSRGEPERVATSAGDEVATPAQSRGTRRAHDVDESTRTGDVVAMYQGEQAGPEFVNEPTGEEGVEEFSNGEALSVTVGSETPAAIVSVPLTPLPSPAAHSPEVDALRELANEDEKSLEDRLFGGRTRSGSGIPPTIAPVSPTPTPDQGLTWRTGQARGIALLAAMHPRARPAVESFVEILLASRVRDLCLGVLVDGTFSRDLGYLADIVTRLTEDGRRLTLVLYFTNGPTMRRFDRTPIREAFNLIPPELFRDLIRHEELIRRQYRDLVETTRPVLELNRARSGERHNVAVVMLEDNLDQESYRAMRNLAGESIGNLVEFVRNPCLGCYPGNDGDPVGDGVEFHEPADLPQLGMGDGFSFDGVGFQYPREAGPSMMSPHDTEQFLRQAVSQELRYLMLWRPEWQGLGDQSIHPDDRSYSAPEGGDRDATIELLRLGLNDEPR